MFRLEKIHCFTDGFRAFRCDNAHKPQLSEAGNHASVLRNGVPGPLGFSPLVVSKLSRHGDATRSNGDASFLKVGIWTIIAGGISTRHPDRPGSTGSSPLRPSGHLTQFLHTLAPTDSWLDNHFSTGFHGNTSFSTHTHTCHTCHGLWSSITQRESKGYGRVKSYTNLS